MGKKIVQGGIIIPDTAQEKPMEGKVVSVGGGARNENGQVVALDVKATLFGKWSGTEVKIDGKELLIMKESDIMGILRSNWKVFINQQLIQFGTDARAKMLKGINIQLMQ